MRRVPFKGHRFPREIILLAVRWYCRYPLSYQDVRDLLAERGVEVDAATIYRWVQKSGPEIARRAFRHRSWRGLGWHVDETYVRVGGRWRYLWRAVDQRGRLIDFRLTARRNLSAARAFLRQAREAARLYQPLSITTDKAHSYVRAIAELNHGAGPDDRIEHVRRRRENTVIESDHATLKRLIGCVRSPEDHPLRFVYRERSMTSRSCPTGLIDAQWALLAAHRPAARPGGVDLRAVVGSGS